VLAEALAGRAALEHSPAKIQLPWRALPDAHCLHSNIVPVNRRSRGDDLDAFDAQFSSFGQPES
jgi:hypothetical protein